MITAGSSLTDVCFAVCTALDAVGVTAVLTGGSAAQYYAPNQYQSYDADFMIQFERPDANGAAALSGLGYYYAAGAYHHPENPYTVDFPRGPFGIGDDLVQSWDTIRRDGEVLHILDRTDSVRDRLAGFYFWNDRQSLVVATAVARSGAIRMERIAAWSEREGQMAKFREFAECME
ncbi:MAG TPA: hypothetical protein VIN40_01455 [Candidatus Tyrphobacter sp.]